MFHCSQKFPLKHIWETHFPTGISQNFLYNGKSPSIYAVPIKPFLLQMFLAQNGVGFIRILFHFSLIEHLDII